jgi:ATP-dependent exoDNAse (exonuclease V) alpha subunit
MERCNVLSTEDLESYDVVPKNVQKLLTQGKNVTIHGAAGTGKSTILRAIVKKHKNCVVLSPTGIAALNVGGQTLHSFFGLPFGMINPVDLKGVPRNYDVLGKRPLIIIDEISMVRSDVFNAIDLVLKKTLYRNTPFAGLQVLLLGDTGQLPPIVTNAESKYFEDEGSEMFFASKAYKDGRFQLVELEDVFRQSNEKFIEFLFRVRTNDIKSKHIDWFNEKVDIVPTREYLKRDDPTSTVLCMTNMRADEYNITMFDRLTTEEVVYNAEITGRFNEAEYPTYPELHLKVGTKVVLLRNAKDKSYVNGTVGLVTKLGKNCVWVAVKGEDIKVEFETWEKFAYVDSPNGAEKKVVGTFKQIPVRLAWAVTVHKSQGMTLSRFHLDLERRPFTHGQMYVALSRARSIKGITSTRPIQRADIIVDRSKLLRKEAKQ